VRVEHESILTHHQPSAAAVMGGEESGRDYRTFLLATDTQKKKMTGGELLGSTCGKKQLVSKLFSNFLSSLLPTK